MREGRREREKGRTRAFRRGRQEGNRITQSNCCSVPLAGLPAARMTAFKDQEGDQFFPFLRRSHPSFRDQAADAATISDDDCCCDSGGLPRLSSNSTEAQKFPVRDGEAQAIRTAVLVVSGRLVAAGQHMINTCVIRREFHSVQEQRQSTSFPFYFLLPKTDGLIPHSLTHRCIPTSASGIRFRLAVRHLTGGDVRQRCLADTTDMLRRVCAFICYTERPLSYHHTP